MLAKSSLSEVHAFDFSDTSRAGHSALFGDETHSNPKDRGRLGVRRIHLSKNLFNCNRIRFSRLDMHCPSGLTRGRGGLRREAGAGVDNTPSNRHRRATGLGKTSSQSGSMKVLCKEQQPTNNHRFSDLKRAEIHAMIFSLNGPFDIFQKTGRINRKFKVNRPMRVATGRPGKTTARMEIDAEVAKMIDGRNVGDWSKGPIAATVGFRIPRI